MLVEIVSFTQKRKLQMAQATDWSSLYHGDNTDSVVLINSMEFMVLQLEKSILLLIGIDDTISKRSLDSVWKLENDLYGI